jgi:hypothetical protein
VNHFILGCAMTSSLIDFKLQKTTWIMWKIATGSYSSNHCNKIVPQKGLVHTFKVTPTSRYSTIDWHYKLMLFIYRSYYLVRFDFTFETASTILHDLHFTHLLVIWSTYKRLSPFISRSERSNWSVKMLWNTSCLSCQFWSMILILS